MSSLTWASEPWELLPPGSRSQSGCEEPSLRDLEQGSKTSSERHTFNHTLKRCLWGVLVIIFVLKLLYVAQKADTIFLQDVPVSFHRLVNFSNEQEASFFPHWSSHKAIPAVCYSHNAHGRRVPLESSISSGCTGIEMTVYPSGNELLVGPHPDVLSNDFDFHGHYLRPLLNILQENNTPAQRLRAGVTGDQINGVFADDPTRSLVLLIRLQTHFDKSWSLLVPQLQALREAGFLTHYNGSKIVQGPVTIVAGGDAPFHRILEGSTMRDIFYDVPLQEFLSSSTQSWDQDFGFSAQNSYFTSADLYNVIGEVGDEGFSQSQISKVRNHVRLAHAEGLKLRYWDSMGWPREHRNHVWRALLHEGVDSITIHR